jgi:4'-phosphopantetheinyl transferase
MYASYQRKLALRGQAVDVWLAFYDDMADERRRSSLRMLLSDAEREQEKRFHFADDRQRYLVTRAMVRTVLSRYTTVAPADWVFSTSAYGRPEIANRDDEAQALCFNISHTRGLIALGISRHRALGVDVENVVARQLSMGIADRFFSPSEAAELASVAPERRQDRFFEYWTFKESYIKAKGKGLSIPLDQFSFRYPHERAVRVDMSPELGDDESRWSFSQFRPTPEHLLAICAERLDREAPFVTMRKMKPTFEDEVVDVALLKTSEMPWTPAGRRCRASPAWARC